MSKNLNSEERKLLDETMMIMIEEHNHYTRDVLNKNYFDFYLEFRFGKTEGTIREIISPELEGNYEQLFENFKNGFNIHNSVCLESFRSVYHKCFVDLSKNKKVYNSNRFELSAIANSVRLLLGSYGINCFIRVVVDESSESCSILETPLWVQFELLDGAAMAA